MIAVEFQSFRLQRKSTASTASTNTSLRNNCGRLDLRLPLIFAPSMYESNQSRALISNLKIALILTNYESGWTSSTYHASVHSCMTLLLQCEPKQRFGVFANPLISPLALIQRLVLFREFCAMKIGLTMHAKNNYPNGSASLLLVVLTEGRQIFIHRDLPHSSF